MWEGPLSGSYATSGEAPPTIERVVAVEPQLKVVATPDWRCDAEVSCCSWTFIITHAISAELSNYLLVLWFVFLRGE